MVKNSQKLYRFFTGFHFGNKKKVLETEILGSVGIALI